MERRLQLTRAVGAQPTGQLQMAEHPESMSQARYRCAAGVDARESQEGDDGVGASRRLSCCVRANETLA